MGKLSSIVFLLFFGSFQYIISIKSIKNNCNEAVCASLVSKCLLIKSCGCDMRHNCTCCKDCYKCLQNLYGECCNCVDMCPDSLTSPFKKSVKSTFEDLPSNSLHQLFNVLTEEADSLNRWTIFKYPIYEDLEILTPDWQKFKIQLGQTLNIYETELLPDSDHKAHANDTHEIVKTQTSSLLLNGKSNRHSKKLDQISKLLLSDPNVEFSQQFQEKVKFDKTLINVDDGLNEKSLPHETDEQKTSTVNCTVLYMAQCMSLHKCRMTCYSMGASKFRWFHDACCQCIGNTCLSYGKNESKCLKCPAILNGSFDYSDRQDLDADSLHYDEL